MTDSKISYQSNILEYKLSLARCVFCDYLFGYRFTTSCLVMGGVMCTCINFKPFTLSYSKVIMILIYEYMSVM